MRSRTAWLSLVASLVVGGCQSVAEHAHQRGISAYEEGRYEEALSRFKSLADRKDFDGRPSAQMILAEMYLRGLGTPFDYPKALRLLEAASEGPDRDWRVAASTKLGGIYERGLPGTLDRDFVKAAAYYKRAADAGDESGAALLARVCRYPEAFVAQNASDFRHPESNVPPGSLAAAFKAHETGDAETAFRLFLWHARNGDTTAQRVVAQAFKEGAGTPRDPARYAAWTWIAARSGDSQAQFEIGTLHSSGGLVPLDDVLAEAWLQRAADQNVVEALNALGIIALHPTAAGRQPDEAKAAGLFTKAIEAGSLNALVNLGDLYLTGRGVPKDREAAFELYQLAADAGSAAAKRQLFAEFEVVSIGKRADPTKVSQSPFSGRPDAAPIPPVVVREGSVGSRS